MCPQAFFLSTKTQKHTFLAPQKVTFLVLMCKVSGWLAHKKTQLKTQFPEDFAAPRLEFSGNEFNYLLVGQMKGHYSGPVCVVL